MVEYDSVRGLLQVRTRSSSQGHVVQRKLEQVLDLLYICKLEVLEAYEASNRKSKRLIAPAGDVARGL